MARVTWSLEALSQLELIRAYIGQFDPNAAHRIAKGLFAAGKSLRDFPRRGRPASGDFREIPTVPPYVLQYEFRDGDVHILRDRHGRQRR